MIHTHGGVSISSVGSREAGGAAAAAGGGNAAAHKGGASEAQAVLVPPAPPAEHVLAPVVLAPPHTHHDVKEPAPAPAPEPLPPAAPAHPPAPTPAPAPPAAPPPAAPHMHHNDDAKPSVKSEPRNGLEKIDSSQFIDPIERSLASLERSLNSEAAMANMDMGNINDGSMRLKDEFSLAKQQQMIADAAHQTLMAQLGGLADMPNVPDALKNEIFAQCHNGFSDKNLSLERELQRPDLNMMPSMTSAPVTSLFDAVTCGPHTVISQPHQNTAHMTMAPVKKEDTKPLLTPKPIEDLMGIPNIMNNNVNDRTKYEIEKKIEEQNKANFAQAFKSKQEQNLKNAMSWSSLAQSPQTQPPPAPPVGVPQPAVKQKPVMDSFQVSLNYPGYHLTSL